MAVTLHTWIRPRPGTDGEPRRIEATGDTYQQAHAALTAQVPDGWQILGLSTWPL